MAEASAAAHIEPSASDIRLVIAASSAGTIFEWYDFFIYGALGSILSKAFFPTGNATLAMLLFWLVFAVGFGFRPLGAILFGYLGDKLGRKYTFLVTVTLMGIATAGVGLVPSAESIGYAAPVIVILLRVLQGLALGGEYGGAAIYVAEHSAPERRGYFTSLSTALRCGPRGEFESFDLPADPSSGGVMASHRALSSESGIRLRLIRRSRMASDTSLAVSGRPSLTSAARH